MSYAYRNKEHPVMSTNFYWKAAPNHPLYVYGDIHIGKRSGGWVFTCQAFKFDGAPEGTRTFEVSPEGLSVSVAVPAAPALHISSWQEWKGLLLQPDSVVTDEYGSTLPAQDFIQEVETTLSPRKGYWGQDKRPLLNHFDELKKNEHRYGALDPERDWKDAEGYPCTLSYFS
jgi:hypothetical protein